MMYDIKAIESSYPLYKINGHLYCCSINPTFTLTLLKYPSIMFYSHSSENEKFTMFSLLLTKLIAGENSYKEVIDPVIQEAIGLYSGERNLYTITKRDSLPIIIYLKEQGKELLPHLGEKNKLEIEDYRQVFNIMSTHSRVIHL